MAQTIFTQLEVRKILLALGMTLRDAKIGSAIAMCEAPAYGAETPSADFSKIGDQELANNVWGNSYGGFQIRSLRAQKGTDGVRDEDRLLEPMFNCRSAKTIHDNSGWKAWSTFTSGQFKAYLPKMYPPPPNTYVVLAGDTLTGIADKLGIDWRELARVNDLYEPWAIYIGDQLTLP